MMKLEPWRIFWSVSRRVQMNLIFLDNLRILFFYPAMSKVQTNYKKCLKRAELNIFLIDVILFRK
jgi:hypothetical protein